MSENQNPEQKARDQIDALLRQAGWVVQSAKQIDLGAGRRQAVREWLAQGSSLRTRLGDRAGAVDRLLELMLPRNTRQAEIVATLYAAWNNLLLQGAAPDDKAIVAEAREDWYESKLAIEREKFFRGLQWMREKGLVPSGRGRPVGHKDGAVR